MPVVTFACPKCGKVLKSPTPIPAGKKIKCPTCAAISTGEVPVVRTIMNPTSIVAHTAPPRS